MSFLLTKTPILTNTDFSIDILNNLPIGVVIIEKELIQTNCQFKIAYSNTIAKKLLHIPKNYDFPSFKNILEDFKEHIANNQNIQSSLYDNIFHSYQCGINKTYTYKNNPDNLIYVKIKYYNMKIIITVDNYADERQNLQNKFIKTVAYEYLLTIYHEINNPLNSLIGTLSDIINTNLGINFHDKNYEINLSRIDLLVFLIRFFLKNFILYFQLSALKKNDINNKITTINLQNLIGSISKKFSKLLKYKQINYMENINLLQKKNINLNYFYFKNLLNIIYSYFYQINEKGGNLTIAAEKVNFDKNTIKIVFSNAKPFQIFCKNHTGSDEEKRNLKVKNKIQTIQMNEEIISKISNLLGIKTEIEKDKKYAKVSIYLKTFKDEEFGVDSELCELTPTHQNNVKELNRIMVKETLNDLKKLKALESSLNIMEKDLKIKNESKINFLSSLTPNLKSKNLIKNKIPNILSNMLKNLKRESFLENNTYDKINEINLLEKNKFNKIRTTSSFSSNNRKKSKISFKEDNSLHDITIQSEEEENSKKNSIISSDIISENSDSDSGINKGNLYTSNQINNNNININLNNNSNKNIRLSINNDPNESTPFTLISVSPIDFQKPLYNPKKKKHTLNCGETSLKNLNKFQKELKNPNQKYSFKSVIDNQFKRLTLSGCSCNDVLIVDDEQFNLSCLSNMLLKMKIKSDVCYNGQECLDKINKKLKINCNCGKTSYKLILMDLLMPKMNGLEATQQIQRLCDEGILDQNYINIVFISACVDQESNFDKIKQNNFILKEFYAKPIKKEKIEEIIHKYYLDN